MSEHFWGEPNSDGVRACVRHGCTVRVANHYRVWQRKKGGHWRLTENGHPIPECAGAKLAETPKPE